MGKPNKVNPFLAKMEARYEQHLKQQRIFTIQQCKDIALMAAGDEFGFGPERAKRLADAFDKTFMEYALTVVKDAKGDRDLWYTKAKIDERLKKICGKYFKPWSERYGE